MLEFVTIGLVSIVVCSFFFIFWIKRNEKELNTRIHWCEEQCRHLQQTYCSALKRIAILEKIPVDDYEDAKPKIILAPKKRKSLKGKEF